MQRAVVRGRMEKKQRLSGWWAAYRVALQSGSEYKKMKFTPGREGLAVWRGRANASGEKSGNTVGERNGFVCF